MAAIKAAGFKPGADIYISLDVAATELYANGRYELKGEGRTLNAAEMVATYADLVASYPIYSIEDGMSEDDWEGWRALTEALGDRVQLVGDDLFVTNVTRLKQGIDQKIANAILVKVNQIGTLERDARRRAHGARGRLRGGDVASLRRDRGRDHRRPRRRHQLRADQDRLARPLRPRGQI